MSVGLPVYLTFCPQRSAIECIVLNEMYLPFPIGVGTMVAAGSFFFGHGGRERDPLANVKKIIYNFIFI
jgi:hypothetical protein